MLASPVTGGVRMPVAPHVAAGLRTLIERCLEKKPAGHPTPTPTAQVVVRKGHVHCAWVPAFGIAVPGLATLVFGVR